MHLTVSRQPPERWYNQQRGRSDCFHVDIALAEGSERAEELGGLHAPINVELLYENMRKVEPQGILQLLDIPEMQLTSRRCTLRVRINDISKNHQRQSFRLRIELALPLQRLEVVTSPILVMSRKSTSKVAAKTKTCSSDAVETLTSRGKRRRKEVNDNRVGGWAQAAYAMLKQLEWTQIGFEVDPLSRSGQIDRKRPIFRCPVCYVARYVGRDVRHSDGCRLAAVLREPIQSDAHRDDKEPLEHLKGGLRGTGNVTTESSIRAVFTARAMATAFPAVDSRGELIGCLRAITTPSGPDLTFDPEFSASATERETLRAVFLGERVTSAADVGACIRVETSSGRTLLDVKRAVQAVHAGRMLFA